MKRGVGRRFAVESDACQVWRGYSIARRTQRWMELSSGDEGATDGEAELKR